MQATHDLTRAHLGFVVSNALFSPREPTPKAMPALQGWVDSLAPIANAEGT